MLYAKQFMEIPNTLEKRSDLREAILELIEQQPMPGKVTEGDERLHRFREILKLLVLGKISLDEAYKRTEIEIPRSTSIYADNNKIFPVGWAERLVRTQYSRFYNQAVMEKLLKDGQKECFVPHTSTEEPTSRCSIELAGNNQDLNTLYNRLIYSYAQGNWSDEPKIPDHPHCTHVITPIEE